jgi:hypothetical protein
LYSSVKSVSPLEDYKLLIIFDNEESRIFDLKPYLEHGIFSELKNQDLFKTVHVNFDTVEWANSVDLCPETLYNESVPV